MRQFYYLLYGLVLAALVIFVLYLESAAPELKTAILQENGPVESLSALGYFVCLGLLLFRSKRCGFRWYFALILLFLGMRELDFQARFLTMSLTKSRFYLSPAVPLAEKLIGAGVLLLFFGCIFLIIRNHWRSFLNSLRRLDPQAIGIAGGILFIILSKTIDGLGRKLAAVGVTISQHLDGLSWSIEELLELGIPILFLLAIAACSSNHPAPKQD